MGCFTTIYSFYFYSCLNIFHNKKFFRMIVWTYSIAVMTHCCQLFEKLCAKAEPRKTKGEEEERW